VDALNEFASTITNIQRIIASYERTAGPRADGLAVPVEVQDRVMRFRECVFLVQLRVIAHLLSYSTLEYIRGEWEKSASEGTMKQYLAAENINSNILDLNRKVSGAMSMLQASSCQTSEFVRAHIIMLGQLETTLNVDVGVANLVEQHRQRQKDSDICTLISNALES
jgi:hypothetical protein